MSVWVCVYMFECLCPPLRLLIISGMMWCDIDPYDWLNKFYVAVVLSNTTAVLNLNLYCIHCFVALTNVF